MIIVLACKRITLGLGYFLPVEITLGLRCSLSVENYFVLESSLPMESYSGFRCSASNSILFDFCLLSSGLGLMDVGLDKYLSSV